MLSNSLPLDAVMFTSQALLARGDAAPGDPTRAGARRLLAGLAGQGLRVAVLANPDESRGTLMARLTNAGIGPLPVIEAQHLFVGEAPSPDAGIASALAGLASPERVLVVTGPADPVRADTATSFAGTVMIAPDQPITKPLLAWLSARVGTLPATAALVSPLDGVAADLAAQRHINLTKPPGSLGHIEELGIQLAGISGRVPPPSPYPATVAVFAADHGVHAQGVSPWPQEVTSQMVANFLNRGAAINVLANQVGAEVVVVDVGVAADLPLAQGLLDRKVAYGTGDLAVEPAMTYAETLQAMEIGAEVAGGLVSQGVRCLLTGDMGIANTTPSAALAVALTGRRAGDITGRGAGLAEADVPRKATIVAEAAARAREIYGDDALGILSEIGGLEHAALVGYMLGGAALGVPVVVDGVIAASALLVAARLVPGIETLAIAGHRSLEPASGAILDDLGLHPVMDLDLRLGEGTGAVMALPVLDAATRILGEMATFDQAGVSSKD